MKLQPVTVRILVSSFLAPQLAVHHAVLRLADHEAPKRCQLRRARGVERIGFVRHLGMMRTDIHSSRDLQPRRVESRQ